MALVNNEFHKNLHISENCMDFVNGMTTENVLIEFTIFYTQSGERLYENRWYGGILHSGTVKDCSLYSGIFFGDIFDCLLFDYCLILGSHDKLIFDDFKFPLII